MTDREMAIALGDFVLQLRRRIETLRALLHEHGITSEQTPWEDVSKLNPREKEIQRFFASEIDELHRTLSEQTPASAVIRVLHNHFLGR